jgi:hypothetical protein
MPTGPKHQRFIPDDEDRNTGYTEDCRCTIGEDHDDDGGGGQSLSVHDAADIWRSNGMDEDYTFGYSESELRRAADES